MTDWPRENDATLAVEAAARKVYETDTENRRPHFPPGTVFPSYDDIDPVRRNQYREAVLPYVWAALSALPDPRRDAWLEGLYCGLREGYEDDNPYKEA